MKVLFLDIDGVLNGHEKLESGYCGIRSDCVGRLNQILDAVPDCKLVISSAWRYMTYRGDMTLAGFEYLLLVHGIKAYQRVAGVTDADPVAVEPCHFDAETWKANGIRWRAGQIADYIARCGVGTYAVLDDLPLDIDRFVRTDGAVGLMEADANKVIALLDKAPTVGED